MYYKPEDVFTGGELYKEFDENLMREYLNMFNLNNLNICFLSQKFEKECTNIEKYYGIKYYKEKLNIKNVECQICIMMKKVKNVIKNRIVGMDNISMNQKENV